MSLELPRHIEAIRKPHPLFPGRIVTQHQVAIEPAMIEGAVPTRYIAERAREPLYPLVPPTGEAPLE